MPKSGHNISSLCVAQTEKYQEGENRNDYSPNTSEKGNILFAIKVRPILVFSFFFPFFSYFSLLLSTPQVSFLLLMCSFSIFRIPTTVVLAVLPVQSSPEVKYGGIKKSVTSSFFFFKFFSTLRSSARSICFKREPVLESGVSQCFFRKFVAKLYAPCSQGRNSSLFPHFSG